MATSGKIVIKLLEGMLHAGTTDAPTWNVYLGSTVRSGNPAKSVQGQLIQWDEPLYLWTNEQSSFFVELKHPGHTDIIGMAEIPIPQLKSTTGSEQDNKWYPLHKNQKEVGQVHFWIEHHYEERPVIALHKHIPNHPKAIISNPDDEPKVKEEPAHGKICIKLLQGMLHAGTTDAPTWNVYLGNKYGKGNPAKSVQGQLIDWDEAQYIWTHREKYFYIELKHQNKFFGDIIGVAQIPIPQVTVVGKEEKDQKWYPIYLNGTEVGQVHFYIVHTMEPVPSTGEIIYYGNPFLGVTHIPNIQGQFHTIGGHHHHHEHHHHH